ncbi:MAG TPA: hypothetical protein VGH81_14405 [Rudaea sp.]|jgi:hypothetical protein
MKSHWWIWLGLLATLSGGAQAAPFFFSTGNADGQMAAASRAPSPAVPEIAAADDFVLALPTRIQSATITGLLPSGATASDIGEVVVEIYRVFPLDSTSPPSGNVPTRTNSPSDNAIASRDSASSTLNFTFTLVNPNFTAANSVLNGIHPQPNQTTGGEGAASGEEGKVNVAFPAPIALEADHYFFVVELKLSSGNFYWLSAPKPIVAPGTPFANDLQAWIRNAALAPDWLRIGTDIVGGLAHPQYNLAFSISGDDDTLFTDGFE